MKLLLKWCLSEYRRYWFKSAATFVGLVLGLSIFLVIELYVGLLAHQNNGLTFLPTDYFKIINTQGFIQTDQVRELLNKTPLDSVRPFSERQDKIQFKEKTLTTRVIGLDILDFQAQLSGQDSSAIELGNFNPFNLNNVFFISSDLAPGEMTIKSLLADRPLTVITIQEEGVAGPLMIMDIAYFQTLYETNNTIDELIIDTEAVEKLSGPLATLFPNLQIRSLTSELEEKSTWTNSLRYNLKFLALIAMIVSMSLLVQFFRFIGFQRLEQVEALFKLGVSKRKLARVIGIECLIVASLVFIGAIGTGYCIAFSGVSIFNQTVSTFYLNLTPTNLQFSASLILKLISIVILSVAISYLSITRKLFARPLRLNRFWLSISSLLMMIIPIGVLQLTLSEWQLFAIGAYLISGFLLFSIAVILSFSKWLSRLKTPKLVFFKMARSSLEKDPVSYGIIAFVIGLSLGLIVCMGVFVESFRTSVSTWLNQVIKHELYIQHKTNAIQFPVFIPKDDEMLIDASYPKDAIYKISRIPITWRGIPSQIQLVDERDNIDDILVSRAAPHPTLIDIGVSEPFANRHGLRAGDTIRVDGLMKEPLHISAVYYDYTSEFGTIRIHRDLYEKENGPLRPHGIAIATVDPLNTNSASALAYLSEQSDITVQSRAQIKKQSIDLFNETFAFTWFMVFLIGGIAMICVSNVLTIMCLDRKKELYQLWMIGFNQARLDGILFAQLALSLTVSLVIAITLGFLLYYFLVYGIQLPTFHWSIFLTIPWPFLGTVLLLFLGLSRLSSWLFIKLNFKTIREGNQFD